MARKFKWQMTEDLRKALMSGKAMFVHDDGIYITVGNNTCWRPGDKFVDMAGDDWAEKLGKMDVPEIVTEMEITLRKNDFIVEFFLLPVTAQKPVVVESVLAPEATVKVVDEPKASPKKYATDEERRLARNEASRRCRAKKAAEKKGN